MSTTSILSQSQAEAIYSAMCALNNVGGKVNNLHVGRAVVSADVGSAIHIYNPESDERYADQAAFAAAYGLQTEGQKRRQERRERDEQYLMYGVEETRTGSRA